MIPSPVLTKLRNLIKEADRKAYFTKRNVSKVCLNTSIIERWKRLKEENEITSDQEFVDILLNLYEALRDSSIQMRHAHDETLTVGEVFYLNLEQTCPELPEENDIFNITINGHNGDEIDQEYEDKGTAPQEYVFTVDVVTPEPEAIKMEKCIVFTDTLMLLITSLYGSVYWGCNSGHVGGRWAA
ncbi:Hypothetical predicted protein [Paramuricea clavata]|uniref:Uncharacterized protein n=1 Tax=Paramuricea clavata TaxID=317549 RepID=A0A6S7FKH2_PARCT|nr:Hypothetical predicted protein [Paramuricea clavata]